MTTEEEETPMTGESVRASNALTARWARAAFTGRAGALSAAGLWPLLALLSGAAREPGRAELREAAGVDAALGGKHARELLGLLDGSTAASGALGVWARADLPLEPSWREAVPEGSRGELSCDPAGQARLDGWVERHTGGRLTRMPIEVRPDTLLVLATALSVDTRWRQPFQNVPLRIERGPWGGRARDAAGLSRTGRDLGPLALAETPAGPVTLLTVAGEDDVDVVLCLGEPERPAGEVLAAAVEATGGHHPVRQGEELLERARAGAVPGVGVFTIDAFTPEPTLSVTTVRFDLAAEHDLLERAGLFGLATVSDGDPRGHFPGISRVPLRVDQARQDVTATFTAEGFKAAAVTAFAVAAAGIPMSRAPFVSARFDRPFGCVARHRPSGLALLAGWIAEPEDWPDGLSTSPW
ncbi:hypothetical protein [Spirillospora sp. NPDC029432]|uniref:hypothetical protein n=1 Tax=Spirillospora sp. NPDC029432 TaxID=3154599 RepID=UPI003452019D